MVEHLPGKPVVEHLPGKPVVEHLPGKQKSWVRIPPEAAHFSLKKGRWVVSGVVMLFVICVV